MKITIVEPNGTGGLIHFAYQMANALADCGAEVTLVTATNYELGDLPHRFTVDPSMKLMPIIDPDVERRRKTPAPIRHLRRIQRGVMLFRAWFRLTRRLRREKPDAVIVSILYFPFQALCLKAIATRGIPLIQVCHEIEQRDTKRSLWERFVSRPLLAIGYRAFTAIVFLARSAEQEFVAALGPLSHRVVLPHGPQLLFQTGGDRRADIAATYGIMPQDRVILFFGILRPSKGIEDLVHAFAMLPDRSRTRLVIAGYPAKTFDLAGLRSLIQDLGIADQTSLRVGYVPNHDVAGLLEAAEVAVFPYRNATASGAVSAAQSLGRPVVATSVGGLKEVIEDGVTGRLVPPNDPTALSAAIQAILADPEGARHMADASHADLMRHRSWPVFAKGVVDILARNENGELPDCANEIASATRSQK